MVAPVMGELDPYDLELAPSLWAGKALAVDPVGNFVELAFGRGGVWRNGLSRVWRLDGSTFRRIARSTGPRRLTLCRWQPWKRRRRA
jgi:hypothetical protein